MTFFNANIRLPRKWPSEAREASTTPLVSRPFVHPFLSRAVKSLKHLLTFKKPLKFTPLFGGILWHSQVDASIQPLQQRDRYVPFGAVADTGELDSEGQKTKEHQELTHVIRVDLAMPIQRLN